ncbi:hypothetical protein TUM9839_11470 [Klebsiella pneumoniae subsp. pneumoniae]|nr:hypothetical protein TUM9839_11470 [Klebsiella pneumoniae subsp. pneumoniae]
MFPIKNISLYGERSGSELAVLRINCNESSGELEYSDVQQSPAPFALKKLKD